jgi:hypothetical protein
LLNAGGIWRSTAFTSEEPALDTDRIGTVRRKHYFLGSVDLNRILAFDPLWLFRVQAIDMARHRATRRLYRLLGGR